MDILALGAQTKSSFCFVKKGVFYPSECGGDLSDLRNFELFRRSIKRQQWKLKIKPEIIACDLHPGYTSTRYAKDMTGRSGIVVKAVQHHVAHIASCMVDNKVEGKVIGVAFDGTGFGMDGNIWGGEFFVGTLKTLKRDAHLRYVPMPGGDAAVKEPWRMALSYLYNIYGCNIPHIQKLERVDKRRVRLIIQTIDKRINSPLTSSMGRLFDAVSSMLGICDIAKYEGEAAIELEKKISLVKSSKFKVRSYRFHTVKQNGVFIICPEMVIRGIVKDLRNKIAVGDISLKFHNAVCYMIKDVCNLLREKYGINKVCLSGGVFQNKFLMRNIRPTLEKEDFEVYLHSKIPSHDGGIALGQAAIAVKRED